MSLYLPPTTTNQAEYNRKIALAVNTLLRRSLTQSDTPPPNPQPGDAYFDTTDNVGKVFDGTVFKPLW